MRHGLSFEINHELGNSAQDQFNSLLLNYYLLDIYNFKYNELFFKETSDGVPPETIEPLSEPFCQCCEDKEKRIKVLKKQHQQELLECQYNLDMLRMYNKHNKD